MAFAAWLASAKIRNSSPPLQLLARSIFPFGVAFSLGAIVLTVSPYLENFTRLQPMRSFHLVYALFFLLLGGLVGEYFLRNKPLRWLALFVPITIGMYFMQLFAYPASAHIEWPGVGSVNPWINAFYWIRRNTPKDAVFAMDPAYMLAAGEDMHGFRAIAERSTVADAVKDSGAVSLFPGLADEWQSHVKSVTGWKHFQAADFERLARQYRVSWFLYEAPVPAGLVCEYTNKAVAVCRLNNAMRREGSL